MFKDEHGRMFNRRDLRVVLDEPKTPKPTKTQPSGHLSILNSENQIKYAYPLLRL